MLDDDNLLEDFAGLPSPQIPETGVPSVLNSAVTLGHASGGIVTYAAGTQIHAIAQVQVTNTTTGETGYAQVVAIGLSPSFSPSYLAFPFPVSEGNVLTFVPTDNVPLDGNAWVSTHAYTYDQLACFCRGTMIQTADSEIPIEDLKVGDLIRTIDHGNQSIRWIGYSKHAAVGELAPIRIQKGALGNTRDLFVSPQHRMMCSGPQTEVLFGEQEVLVAAKALVNDQTIRSVEGGEVEYFHILFDTHEIIFSEGCPSESFHPGEAGSHAFGEATRKEVLTLFPSIADDIEFSSYGPSARPTLSAHEGVLIGRTL